MNDVRNGMYVIVLGMVTLGVLRLVYLGAVWLVSHL